ncbi:MAG: hypothetical protein U0670_11805 [Anaerolineae bacterium]
MTNRPYLRLITFTVLLLAVITAACRCSYGIALQCAEVTTYYGIDGLYSVGFEDCANAVDLACPEAAYGDPAANAAEAACVQQAVAAWDNNQPLPTPGGYPTNALPDNPFDGSGTQNIVAPQPQLPVDCSLMRLTAPLDGLPNGMTTFYWDPLPGPRSFVYRIRIFDENGTPLLSDSNSPDGHSLPSNVAQSAIGGGYTLRVVLQGIDGVDRSTILCEDEHWIPRSAANGGGQQPAGATPTYYETPQPPPR